MATTTSPIVLDETFQTKMDAQNESTNNQTATLAAATEAQTAAINTQAGAINTSVGAQTEAITEQGNAISEGVNAQTEAINTQGGNLVTALSQKLEAQNQILVGILNAQGGSLKPTSIKEVANIVRAGYAQQVFHVGDQIIDTWKDIATDAEYECPWNIIGFRDVTLEDGSVVPGMYIQMAYVTPFGVQFSNAQAFYYAATALPAGTYHYTLGSNWGNNAVGGKSYQFTLTQPVPAGGQLRGMVQMPDVAPASWRISSYASPSETTAIETVTPTEGTGGTDMGTMSLNGAIDTSAAYPLNNMQRTGYGNNAYIYSALRQFLNSAEGVGAWWKPQTDYDVPPTQLSTNAGFMSGLSADFINAIRPVAVTTYLNTVAYNGEATTTYDRFFPLSLQEMYINTQVQGEGAAFEYWRLAAGTPSPLAQYNTYPQIITYALDNHVAPQNVRLRSAFRGYADHTWNVYASGTVTYSRAWHSNRCAPACVIC